MELILLIIQLNMDQKLHTKLEFNIVNYQFLLRFLLIML